MMVADAPYHLDLWTPGSLGTDSAPGLLAATIALEHVEDGAEPCECCVTTCPTIVTLTVYAPLVEHVLPVMRSTMSFWLCESCWQVVYPLAVELSDRRPARPASFNDLLAIITDLTEYHEAQRCFFSR